MRRREKTSKYCYLWQDWSFKAKLNGLTKKRQNKSMFPPAQLLKHCYRYTTHICTYINTHIKYLYVIIVFIAIWTLRFFLSAVFKTHTDFEHNVLLWKGCNNGIYQSTTIYHVLFYHYKDVISKWWMGL